jgi:hypothetical protein
MDIVFIACDLVHPTIEIPEPVELSVIDTTETSVSIVQPGEEDMFKITADLDDCYTTETGDQTDIITKLFSTDSYIYLIAEYDAEYSGYYSRILVDLASGKYFVLVRHYKTASGTVNYNIKVSK